ncbi:MAG: LysM peptidoglycan-binding domain-containing protein [Proteobacteria bacterium]|nr:LysM peptidoglycan-binding domain-containing protein [Pseudomonadota bacterium]
MKKTIRKGIQEFQIISWDESHDKGELMTFPDKTSARLFLRSFLNDHVSMMIFRDILKNKSLHCELYRLNNIDITDQLSCTLSNGTIRVAKLPIEDSSWIRQKRFWEEDDYVAPVAKATARDVHWITFKVLEDTSGMPIPDITLSIKLPGGAKVDKTTNEKGLIEIYDITGGDCEISTDIKNAKLENTLAFVDCGRMLRDNYSGQSDPKKKKISGLFIAEIKEHKVKTGETPDSLAQSFGMPWEDITWFNWGAASPDEINNHLEEDVGCTQKNPNNNGFVFDDSDEPGIVYLPKPIKRGRLSTQATHIISVKQVEKAKKLEEFMFSM